jgi:hypothetical protein
MINGDCFDKPARVLIDNETLSLGRYNIRWFDTPHGVSQSSVYDTVKFPLIFRRKRLSGRLYFNVSQTMP